MQSDSKPVFASYEDKHFATAPIAVQIRVRWILRRAVLRNIEERNRWIESPDSSRFVYQGA